MKVSLSCSRGCRSARAATVALIASGAVALQAHAQPPPVKPDDFVAATAGANEYELMAAHLALVESKDVQIRAFATVMLREHGAALTSLRDAARLSGLKPPPSQSVGDGQAALLAALQGLRGKEFDRDYARQQTLAHAQAAANERGYLKDGSDPNLRAVAKADLAMISKHAQAAYDLMVAQAERSR